MFSLFATRSRKRVEPRGKTSRPEPGECSPKHEARRLFERPDQVGVWAVPVVFDRAELTR